MKRSGAYFPPTLPRTERGLRGCWAVAIKRVEDAQGLGWNLYEQSWQATLEAVEQRMRHLGYTPPKRELRFAGRTMPEASDGHPLTHMQMERALRERPSIWDKERG